MGDLKTALQDPTKQNVSNSMNGKDNFQKVVNELHAVYVRYELHVKNYDKLDESLRKRSKWGLVGETEAQSFRRTLSKHKITLIITLNMTAT